VKLKPEGGDGERVISESGLLEPEGGVEDAMAIVVIVVVVW
jgi:hypothetical protein